MKPFSLSLVLLFALVSNSLLAQDKLVRFNTAGKYLVTIDAAGKMTVEQVTIIEVGGDGPVIPPDGPVTPTTLSANAKAIKDEAIKAFADSNRDLTAAQLAVLYQEIAKRILAGEIKGQDAIAFTAKAGADAVIKTNTAAWKPMRDKFGELFVKLAQEGGKDADFAKLFNEVADGLNASVSKQMALGDGKLLELIKIILEIVKNLQANQPARPQLPADK